MTSFERTTLTEKGISLLAKQGTQIEFLGIETGCGTYSSGEDVKELNSVKEKIQSFPICSVTQKSERKIAVKFILSNLNLNEDYRLTEIGLYANDPVEGKILYAICCSTPKNADVFRKYNGIFAYITTVMLNVEINHGSEVIIHPESEYALTEDLEALRKQQPDWNETDEKSHAFIKNKPEFGGGGGNYVDDSPPKDTNLIWIDTSVGGVAKYYNEETNSWEQLATVRYYKNQLQCKDENGDWQPIPLIISTTPSDDVGALWLE